ncbi:hypothetical protein [Psychroserpens luteus]|uniref:Uncharacterized protein n=1 Tax=Psychroserpens luteus TaxID=1434066 RepID=A0ABW5ZXC9_9FLAO|nr:hypothetical protein [Psychroserpens luteus]
MIFSGDLKDIDNDSIHGILDSSEVKINILKLQEEQLNNVIEEIKNLLSKMHTKPNLQEKKTKTI